MTSTSINSHYNHPVSLIRVQTINLFATAKNEKALEYGMEELISLPEGGQRPAGQRYFR